MKNNRAYVRIFSISDDGEQIEEFVLRSEFAVPPTWRRVQTTGIYGEYACGGSDSQPVTWQVFVERQGIGLK